MYGKSARRSSLFLFELMISILMFSVASAWCVRLFVTARSVVSETEVQNRAQNLAAGYAEVFLASKDFDAFLRGEGGSMRGDAEGTRCYGFWYDADFDACEGDGAVFWFEAALKKDGNFEKCSFSFGRTDEKEADYRLDVEKYTGVEAGL